jgi:hypothetical protein
MSVSLVVLLPVILLGIVSLFCFVGCAFHTGGIGGPPVPPFTEYSGLTVLGTPSIAVYWPLDEAMGSLVARERVTNFPNSPLNGKYVDPNTVALPPITPGTIYPWPAVPNIPNPPGADALSAAAPGQLALGQAGLVKGDVKQDASDPSFITTCMVVNGGYVEVPFDPKWNPPSFTLEAWVQVGWQASDPVAWRAVLDGRAQDPICKGFAIIAKVDDKQPPPPGPPAYHWAVIVGNGGTGFMGFSFLQDTGPQITLLNPSPPPEMLAAAPVYLAVTYDAASTTLTLYVNDQPPVSTSASYIPNTSSPLYIGAGVPYSPNRQTPGSLSGGPLFPFVGAIQDVAIYNTALKPTDIRSHFNNGSGSLN